MIHLQSNPVDKKCNLLRQTEMFFLKVLRIYNEKHSDFTKLKSLKTEELKTNKKELKHIKRNISNQTASVFDYSTSIYLDKELDLMFCATKSHGDNNSVTDSWSYTLIDIFSEIQLFVNNLQ